MRLLLKKIIVNKSLKINSLWARCRKLLIFNENFFQKKYVHSGRSWYNILVDC